MTPTPTISIVVPSLNQAPFLRQCLESILGQRAPMEVIVIDGGSTDGSVEIIQEYDADIHYWVSEPDTGQADALNKGFTHATGDILGWLNADDMYLPDAFHTVAASLSPQSSAPALVYGGCVRFSHQEQRTRMAAALPYDPDRLAYYDYINQPSTFWTRELWNRTGPLNTGMTYAFDWEWWLRAREFCSFTPVDQVLSLYRYHQGHKSGSKDPGRLDEIMLLVNTYSTPHMAAAYRAISRKNEFLLKGWRFLTRTLGLYPLRVLWHPGLYLRWTEQQVQDVIAMM